MIGKDVVMAYYKELFQHSLGKTEESHNTSIVSASNSTAI
jgi:hypothetical protein